MKQILQDLANGKTYINESPMPMMEPDSILIRSTCSLISVGTEKMLIDFGKASYLEKARQQPEKVKMVLSKMKTDGLLTTISAVRSKLSQPLPLGYCNVGIVEMVGARVQGFKKGDRVISNGPHADIVVVPKNLCALIPDNVDDESAAFTVVASIGLQGIRLAQPTLGESFVVIGVGLIGLLTVQLLKAHGCRVLAVDLDENKLNLAKQFGADICNIGKGEDLIASSLLFSRGYGVDGVIITASTQSNEPITNAAQICRKRGRIILVGVTGLELKRSDFYEKEITFQVSCSYGPGRYESEYEEKGLDYPIGFVRWTEQRNFEAVLDMLGSQKLNVTSLITHRYPFEQAVNAYQSLSLDKLVLGVVLNYTTHYSERAATKIILKENAIFNPTKAILGVVGAGNYASRILLPVFKSLGTQLHTLVTSGGLTSSVQGKKIGFVHASTDINSVLLDKEINTLIIATRHDSHAHYVIKALNSNKHVFVEKPIAINLKELSNIEAAYHTATASEKKLHLMVGFNRRFSPQIQKIKSLLSTIHDSKVFIVTVNAGYIPANHWTQDISIGGGRLIGEACHFIDLLRFLSGYEITSVQARSMAPSNEAEPLQDKVVITLGFADGSIGTIHYLANGANTFPKERIEIFSAGKILQLNNFRHLTGYGWPKFKKMNLWKQDKGQISCCKAFIEAIEQGLQSPIPFNEIIEVARITIEASHQIYQRND